MTDFDNPGSSSNEIEEQRRSKLFLLAGGAFAVASLAWMAAGHTQIGWMNVTIGLSMVAIGAAKRRRQP